MGRPPHTNPHVAAAARPPPPRCGCPAPQLAIRYRGPTSTVRIRHRAPSRPIHSAYLDDADALPATGILRPIRRRAILPLCKSQEAAITPRRFMLPTELAAGSTDSLRASPPGPGNGARGRTLIQRPRASPRTTVGSICARDSGVDGFQRGRPSRALVGGPGPAARAGTRTNIREFPRTRAVLRRPDRACALTLCFT